jgi:NADH-quinone oxidoreductase subunit N
MIFLSFEIVSISAYVLVASQNKKNIAEAATKYLIFGLFASALMLYGFSLLFGFTGSFYIFESAFTINLLSAPLLTTSFALILIFAGIAFKLGAFPFHFWVADIYEQSSLMIVATVSIVSKIAGIALLANIMPVIWDFDFKNFISWFQPEYLIACMAMLSIAVGNIQALNQQNIHRMLGYSTIAHTGFLLLPFASFEKHAQEAVIYYSMVYVLINYAMFVAIHILDIYKTDAKFADFRGAGWKNPLLGINILIAAIALTGLPPTNGFWGKFYIFSSAFDAYTLEQEMLFLVLFTFGIINAVVGLFYYIKLPYFMFKENNKNTINYSSPRLIIFSLVLNIIVIITFLKPEWLSL